MTNPHKSSPVTLVMSALHFAAHKHRRQRREDAHTSPYINHPIEVAMLLAEVGGVEDGTTLAVALLHDTLEDTHTTAVEVEKKFGPIVRQGVEEVTDAPQQSKALRRRLQVVDTPHRSHRARLIKLADKVANLRDLLDTPPPRWSLDKRFAYIIHAARMVESLRGTNPALEAHFDRLYQRALNKFINHT